MHQIKPLLALLCLCSSLAVMAQTSQFYPLNRALENPTATQISFFPEDERIPEFISRHTEFEQLQDIQVKRYSNSPRSELVLATVSAFDGLKLLHIELLDWTIIPPHLNRLEGLKTLRFSPPYSDRLTTDPQRFLVTNGTDPLVIELIADQETALNYMDRFLAAYPDMVETVNSFVYYPLRNDLEKVESRYKSFDPVWMPASSIAKIDPAQEARLVTREGSILMIPPNAFVDQNNNPVSDSVQIDFTFFADQLDIALSGIDMTVKDSGNTVPLESAGMYEFNASRNGQLLNLAEGKGVQIELASSDDGAYNAYEFDDNAGVWEMTEEDNFPIEEASAFTPAFHTYNERYQDFSTTRSPNDRTVQGSDFFLSQDFIRFEERSQSTWSEYDLTNPEEEAKLIRAYRHSAKNYKTKLPLVVFERQPDKHKSLRQFYFFNLSELNRSFPEMRALKRYAWHTTKPMNSGEFRAEYVRNKSYVDFIVNYDAKREAFEFVFKDVAGRFDTLMAKPFLGNKKMLEPQAKYHLEIVSNYEHDAAAVRGKHVKSKNSIERRYAKAIQSQSERMAKKERSAWERAQTDMTPAELEMSFEAWVAYFDNLNRMYQEQMLAKSMSRLTTRRSVFVTRIGFGNIDHPIYLPPFQKVNILASQAPNKKYRVQALFHNYNTALASDANSIRDRNGPTSYIIIDESGEYLSWILPGEARKVKRKSIETNRPFVPIAKVPMNDLRAQLLAP